MIRVEIKRVIELIDGEGSQEHEVLGVNVRPGDYELVQISNPLGFEDDWLVLKGTFVGQTTKAWANLSDPRMDCLTIEEDIEI